jgi:hypothetical protein
MPEATQAAASSLTDGTGVSAITATKLIKDFVADFLLSASAALATAQIFALQDVVQTPEVAGFAVAGAAIRAGYRIVLRWATT